MTEKESINEGTNHSSASTSESQGIKGLALFFVTSSKLWPYNSMNKKLLSLIINMLKSSKRNYKAASLILI